MSTELRTVNGRTEFYENNVQQTINGELIANVDPDYSVAKLFEDFYATELGEEFLERFDTDTTNPRTNESNAHVIERVFAKLYPDLRMTLSRVADAVTVAIQAGELTPSPEEVVITPPRDEQGRFADAQALLRAEVRRLLADPSVSAQTIRQKADRDRAFGDAFRAELAAPAPQSIPTVVDEDLQAFADAYVAAPSLRPIAGYITLAGTKWEVSRFTTMVENAIAAGLLR